MASKSISQLPQLQAEGTSQVSIDDMLTLVDVSEEAVNKKNKQISVKDFQIFLRDYTALFPIDFNPNYIKPDAYVVDEDGALISKVEISTAVANQVVDTADIGRIHFDSYGRVYDIDPVSNFADIQNLLLATGTTASYYKGSEGVTNTDNQNPQPSTNPTGAAANNSDIAGLFNDVSYYYPPGTQNPSRINYNVRQNNDVNWNYIFGGDGYNWSIFKQSEINITYGGYSFEDTTGLNFVNVESFCNIFIDWINRTISGNGNFAYVSGSIPFSFSQIINAATDYIKILGNVDSGFTTKLAVPKFEVDFNSRQVLSLPIPTLRNAENTGFINAGVPLMLVIKNYL